MKKLFKALDRWGYNLNCEHSWLAETWHTDGLWLEPWHSRVKLRFTIRYDWPFVVKLKLHNWLTILAYKFGYQEFIR